MILMRCQSVISVISILFIVFVSILSSNMIHMRIAICSSIYLLLNFLMCISILRLLLSTLLLSSPPIWAWHLLYVFRPTINVRLHHFLLHCLQCYLCSILHWI
jgi:hypothetical protein